jgi:hypoxanthine phosphoribosyltransferase
MPELIPVLSAEEIARRVKDIAERISSEYSDRELVLIAVLKGSIVFLSDLIRQLTIPVKIDFLQASSYGAGTVSCGKVKLTRPLEIDIRGRDVLLVEDIVDTGTTVNCLLDYLKTFQPKSLRVCALIDKRERREAAVPIAYAGHTVDRGFLVGYGLDFAEDYRHLAGLYHLQL